MKKKYPHIAVVLASLRTGGAERAMVNLANGFILREVETEMVLVEKTGEFISQLSEEVRITDLRKKRARNGIIAFRNYLKKKSPDVLIVAQTHIHFMVIFAILFSNWKGVLILNEQSTFSSNIKNSAFRFLAFLMFRRADIITLVSEGASRDFSEKFPFLEKKIRVVSNPVLSEDLLIKKEEKIFHPFIDKKECPLVLSAGRLTASKNFNLLIDAFVLLLKKTDARLIILGEGEERASIVKQVKELGLDEKVSLTGNVNNPYAYMKRCDVFVLSSDYEGLPSVLIEALACGCKIVSTDCPNGPAEILENGKYGILVPVSNTAALAEAIIKSFTVQNDQVRKLERASDFSIEKITGRYLDLITKFSDGR